MNATQPGPRKRLNDLLSSQRFGVLSTEGDAYPYANLIAFAVTDDLERVAFMTRRDTQKYTNLKSHPTASMLVDNRTNTSDDFHNAVAVTIMGKARELETHERQAMSRLLIDKHPFLNDYLALPSTAVLCLDVSLYRLVEEFQKVTDFEIESGLRE